jgi:outer membrane protein insertion porin family
MGREMSAGFDIYSLRTDFLSQSSFENQSTGIGLRVGFPIGERTSLGFNYQFLQDDTQVDSTQCGPANPTPPLLCLQEGTFLTSVFGYQLNWDRRNDPIFATRGFDFSIGQDLAGIGGEVQYLRTELSGGLYYGLPWTGWRLSLRGNAGYIFGWNGDDIRINDRFFKGGSSFRGFDVAGVGPRQLLVDDTTGELVTPGDALGGNAFAIGTIQLDVPLPVPDSFGLDAALFAEFGTLGIVDAASRQSVNIAGPNTLVVDDAASLRAAAGVTFFWDSPFGPVQFDFAQPIQSEEYDNTEEFRFSTRTRF